MCGLKRVKSDSSRSKRADPASQPAFRPPKIFRISDSGIITSGALKLDSENGSDFWEYYDTSEKMEHEQQLI